jgi:hypothetical protein
LIRLAAGAALVHLAVCLSVLLAVKFGWLTLSRAGLLHFININMMLAAAAATVAAWRGTRPREAQQQVQREAWALFASAALLLAGELMAWAEEFIPAVVSLRVLTLTPPLLSRVAMGALLALCLVRCSREVRGRWKPDLAAATAAATGVAVLGLVTVLIPLWSRGGGASPAIMATADLALLCLSLPALVLSLRARAWLVPLIGLALYLVSDLAYYRHEATGDMGFLVAEMGFYAGFWLMALGALRSGAPHREAA